MKFIKNMLYKSKNSFYLCIISFIMFALMAYSLTFTVVYPIYVSIIIFLIPFVAFLILTILTVKDKISIKCSKVVCVILTIVFIPIMFVNYIFASFNAAIQQTNSIQKYNKVMFITEGEKYSKHFPKQIPSDVSNVKFFRCFRFLQGGDQMYLMFKSSNISEYLKIFSKKAEYIINVGEDNGKGKLNKDYYYNTGIWQLDLEYDYLENNEFIVYIIDCRPYKFENWNHGYTYGAYISEKTNEIIYFMENW